MAAVWGWCGRCAVSVCALVLICVLFVSELRLFLHVDTVDHLYVDVSRGEKLRINFDVTFPHIPCSLLSLDAMDVSGSHQLDVSHHIRKKPLDDAGNAVGEETLHALHSEADAASAPSAASDAASSPKPAGVRAGAQPGVAVLNISLEDILRPDYCGPCYGAESVIGQCCRTCSDVKDAYRTRGWAMPALATVEQCVASGETVDPVVADLASHKGCQMWGYLEVNKVDRNAHQRAAQHALTYQPPPLRLHRLTASSLSAPCAVYEQGTAAAFESSTAALPPAPRCCC